MRILYISRILYSSYKGWIDLLMRYDEEQNKLIV